MPYVNAERSAMTRINKLLLCKLCQKELNCNVNVDYVAAVGHYMYNINYKCIFINFKKIKLKNNDTKSVSQSCLQL